MNGFNIFLVPNGLEGLNILLIHATYVIIEATVLYLIAKQSYQEAEENYLIIDQIKHISDSKKIKLDKIIDTNNKSDIIENFNSMVLKLKNIINNLNKYEKNLNFEVDNLVEKKIRLTKYLFKKKLKLIELQQQQKK